MEFCWEVRDVGMYSSIIVIVEEDKGTGWGDWTIRTSFFLGRPRFLFGSFISVTGKSAAVCHLAPVLKLTVLYITAAAGNFSRVATKITAIHKTSPPSKWIFVNFLCLLYHTAMLTARMHYVVWLGFGPYCDIQIFITNPQSDHSNHKSHENQAWDITWARFMYKANTCIMHLTSVVMLLTHSKALKTSTTSTTGKNRNVVFCNPAVNIYMHHICSVSKLHKMYFHATVPAFNA